MAKLYYSQQRQRYEVAEYNPLLKRLVVIDFDNDIDALAIRQGFMSDDESDEDEDE